MGSFEDVAKLIRKRIIEIGFGCGNDGIHFGGILSLVEIMLAVYSNTIFRRDRDRVVLSKGHGALAQYLALEYYGFLSHEDVVQYKDDFSLCSVHPSRDIKRGIDYSSGSLGQGLSLGCGIAVAKQKSDPEARIYVILGDGECDEGSVWEAVMFAAHMGLRNLVAIVDANGLQYDGLTDDIIETKNMPAKFNIFGWESMDIDGHNTEEIISALGTKNTRPLAIIAHTIKGKGISFMEGEYTWHNRNLTREQYELAMGELETNEL